MAGLVTSGKNAMLDALGAQAAYGSLHSADPGQDGTAEISGGNPAYARRPLTWSPAEQASMASASSITFDVPAETTITHLGYWTAMIGGTYIGSRALDATQPYPTQGTYTIASGGITEKLA